MSTLSIKELSHPAGEVIKIASGKTLDLKSSGTITLPTGSVLQVKSFTGAGATSTSSTFVDIGVGGSITPSSTSSKILAIAHVGGCKTTGHASAHIALQIVRESTSILFFEGEAGYNAAANANSIGACSGIKLDSPSSTSAVNYKIQIKNQGGSSGSVACGGSGAISSITLMEVSA